MATIKKELDTNDTVLMDKLLNGVFDFGGLPMGDNWKWMKRLATYHVWYLVATKCSKETMNLFLTKGVEVHVKSLHDDNTA